MAGIDKGEGNRDTVEMGRHFPHIGKFFDVCTFVLKKTICQTPDPDPVWFWLRRWNRLISSCRAPSVCVLCVCTIVFDCDCVFFVCFQHNLIRVSLTENTSHVFTKHGLCGNSLKEAKISFQTEAKCWSPQIFMWLCHRWQLFLYSHSTKLKASLLVCEIFLFSPMGGSLYHLAGDPQHLPQPRAEGNAPQRPMLGNSEL